MEDIRVVIQQHKTDKIRLEKVYAVFSKLTDLLQNLCSRIETLESATAPVPKQCSTCCCSIPVVDVDAIVEPVPESAPVAPVDEPVTEVEVPVEPLAPVEEPEEVETLVEELLVQES